MLTRRPGGKPDRRTSCSRITDGASVNIRHCTNSGFKAISERMAPFETTIALLDTIKAKLSRAQPVQVTPRTSWFCIRSLPALNYGLRCGLFDGCGPSARSALIQTNSAGPKHKSKPTGMAKMPQRLKSISISGRQVCWPSGKSKGRFSSFSPAHRDAIHRRLSQCSTLITLDIPTVSGGGEPASRTPE